MTSSINSYIATATKRALSWEEANTAFEILFRGEASPIQVSALLTALCTRGEGVDEIAGAAAQMRAACVPIQAPKDAIDIVGTGGTGKATLQISTATAFTVAGAGIPVAKHGNKKISSNAGSADSLGVNGINVMVPAEVAQNALDQAGICFMMAPMHHPAMKHVMPIRLELGMRTVFNILGPLTNPAGVKRQLTGAYCASLLLPMAKTLQILGSEKTWLVHGEDGTDEITVTGKTTLVALENGNIDTRELHPEMAGLPVYNFQDIEGSTPESNGARLRAVLAGDEKGAYRDAVLLNAAAALMISDRANTLKEGVEIARASIDSGKALEKMQALAKLTQP